MKNAILILLLFFVIFLAFKLLEFKQPYAFDIIQEIEVFEHKCEIELITTQKVKYAKWFYNYEIKEDKLYITTYAVVNPLSKRKGPNLELSIDKGYLDFSEIYINQVGGDKLIWSVPAKF